MKQNLVDNWWAAKLEASTQLSNMKKVRDSGHVYEVTNDPRWYSRVDTDALFEDFQDYYRGDGDEDDCGAGSIVKSGFMLMFYRATHAERSRTRRGNEKGKFTYLAAFKDLAWHKEAFNSLHLTE